MAFCERALVETDFDRIHRARAQAGMPPLPTDEDLDAHLVADGFPDRHARPRLVVPHVPAPSHPRATTPRDDAIRARAKAGATTRELATIYSLSHGRISQILNYE